MYVLSSELALQKHAGLSDVADLQKRILEKLDDDNRALFTTQLTKRNLEQALSRVRRIAALLKDSTPPASPSDKTPFPIENLSERAAENLDELVCAAIVTALSIANANLSPPIAGTLTLCQMRRRQR